MRVSIVGTGYVGLVSGTGLADIGHDVVCVDLDQQKVDLINKGVPPIFEVGLPELLERNVGVRLRATTDLREAVLATELTLIAVGTPFEGEQIDLTYVREAARQIGEVLRDKDELPHGRRQEHRRPRHHRRHGAARARAGVGQARRRGLRRRHEPGVPGRGRRGVRLHVA